MVRRICIMSLGLKGLKSVSVLGEGGGTCSRGVITFVFLKKGAINQGCTVLFISWFLYSRRRTLNYLLFYTGYCSAISYKIRLKFSSGWGSPYQYCTSTWNPGARETETYWDAKNKTKKRKISRYDKHLSAYKSGSYCQLCKICDIYKRTDR